MASRLDFPTIPLGYGASRHHTGSRPAVIIEAAAWWPGLRLAELWSYRSLLHFLVWRDIKVKYAQTVFGAGWAILQPVLTMLVFTAIFGIFAGIPSDGVPYSVFALTALVPWLYFSHAIGGASNSLIANHNLITKVYFPRLVIPFAPVVSGLVDFLCGFAFLLLLLVLKGFAPTADTLLLLPLLVAVMVMTATGIGCWLSALNIQYRDVGYVVPFLLQIWMYSSPVFYPASLVPERFHALYGLNPMVGVIEGFRAVLLGTGGVSWATVQVSMAVATMLFVTGVFYFRRTEHVFADVV